VIAAFSTYFCMYAFRKPFTAAAYAEPGLWGIQTKTLLVTAQVIGYTASKFIGIKVIAEMPAGKRIAWLLGLIARAETMLLFFAVAPAPLDCLFLFLNGLAAP
jgi:sugar phosphate permease